jgi:hypothetical protein
MSFKSGNQTINVKLDKSNTMALSSSKPEKPSETSNVEFYPIWQPAAPTHETAEPPGDRVRGSRNLKEASVINPSVTRTQETKLQADQEPRLSTEDSRCSRMHDKRGCLCAVQNGGGISADGRSWYSKRGGTSALTNEAFVQCQIRAGRR